MGGNPKQLIEWQGQTLIRRTVDAALATDLRPVVVVVGANKQQVAPQLTDLPVTIIDNQQWEKGMSTSIKMGLAALYLTQKDIEAVVVLLTDQPLVGRGIIEQLMIARRESGKGIAASRYGDQVGVPALFTRGYFEELLNLEGDRGAKGILHKYRSDIVEVPFEDGAIDLDSPADREQFLGNF